MNILTERRERRAREREKRATTSITSDAVLDIVRRHFESTMSPGARVERVRWSLDGIAIDHDPVMVAAAG